MARPTWDWEGRIGRRIKLRDLHILSAVVRWQSMAKAAAHLAMSQSAVSEAIASLEDALRVRLLDRNSRGIAPTIYADALLKRGRVVFDELQQGIKDIEFLTDPAAGEVRIASPEFLSVWLMPSAIDRLSRQYPQIVVKVSTYNTSTLEFRELQERNVDFVIARIPESFADDDLEIEVLLNDKHFVVTGTRSRWPRQRKIKLAELANEPWIIPPFPAANALIREAFEAEGLKVPRASVIASSIDLRGHLLATGRYITVLSDLVLRGLAKQSSIKVLPIKLRLKSRPIAIVRAKNRTISPAAQLFIEHLRAVVKSM